MKTRFFKSNAAILSLLFLFFSSCSVQQSKNEFYSQLPQNVQRTWIGPEYWANPLQDWQLKDGRIECTGSGGGRNVYLLTRRLGKNGAFKMSIHLGILNENEGKLDEGWVGFKVGVRGQFHDYRSDAVRGEGYPAGITTNGQLFIGGLKDSAETANFHPDDIRLELSAQPAGGKYNLILTGYDKDGKKFNEINRNAVDPDRLTGGVALVCSRETVPAPPAIRQEIDDGNRGFRTGTKRGGNVRFWFAGWQLFGDKIKSEEEHAFGPVLFTQYTLSNQILKLTAQMPPIGNQDPQTVRLEIKKNGKWQKTGEAKIDPLARTARFRIENWKAGEDTEYRLVYGPFNAGKKPRTFYYAGTIRKEPWDKDEIVVAAFTGNNDLGFPNTDIFKQVEYQNPDLLFFSGDQIYEGVGGYGVQRKPVEKAILDYLRKWYLYGWAYGNLMRDRPTVAIPDDHDVYHGNLWGAGGKATPPGASGFAAQDAGGYKMPPEWVNMVQRTQTSHLPDPYDPAPVKQGIGVYFCNLNYGGISFAILEDRKFKSAPKPLLPKADIQNGWAGNRKFSAKKEADAPGAVLLEVRQLNFLNRWAADWSQKTWMKVALSQTIFANVATLPREEAASDAIVPKLRILKKGEYPPDDIPVTDMDSDGWPQTGRNKAVRALRKGFALHIAGDQHLGSAIQYAVNDWHDGGFAFCVPAISNIWPRRWCPQKPGKNPLPGFPRYTGDFEDGFGNKITVYAVSNPVYTGLKPSRLYDRATGYGIVRFNRKTRNIVIECWPRQADPTQPNAEQYPGWPIKINQMDNYGRQAKAYLPRLKVTGMTEPVVQIIDEKNGEIVYTLRIKRSNFQPKVFRPGEYTIKVGEPGSKQEKIFRHVPAKSHENAGELKAVF
ncbi:MAG TPA: twin-arginine translocation pathway signal protein [Bacteroidetes bacterium]|nr:twin-arginine translocation pathway signal protein [Bacteroidota bacterium]